MNLILMMMIPILSLTIGWLYGRNDVDPYTTEGKNYYNPKGE